MATNNTYNFEEMSATQAAALQPGDTLTFSTPTLTPADVVVSNSDNGFNITTITAAGKSLAFPGVALSGTSIQFVSSFIAGEDTTLHIGSTAADSLTVSGDDDGSVAYGFSGNDTISVTGDGAADIYAGEGDDSVSNSGTSGALNIFGGAGEDSLEGGNSNDHIYGYGLTGDPSEDEGDSIDGGAGNDYINGNAGNDLIEGGSGNDRILGGAGNDFIDGGDGIDNINGNKGDDVIIGDAGNDSLRGGADNDFLFGGADNDILQGDLGDDVLLGGTGIDLLTGGAGNDIFGFTGTGDAAFTTTGALAYFTDVVTDFTSGDDTIALPFEVDADILLQDNGVTFTTVAAALTYAQELLDDDAVAGSVAAIQVGADTYLFYDEDGEYTLDGDITSAVLLKGVTAADLTVDDFFVAMA